MSIVNSYQTIKGCTLLDVANMAGVRSLRYLRRVRSGEELCPKSLDTLLSLDLTESDDVTMNNEELKNELRPEVLVPWQSWERPTPAELKAVASAVGSGSELARLLGVSGRTVRKWIGGADSVPYSAWCVMCYEAGLGVIWKNEQED